MEDKPEEGELESQPEKEQGLLYDLSMKTIDINRETKDMRVYPQPPNLPKVSIGPISDHVKDKLGHGK